MHGLIFFFLQKYLGSLPPETAASASGTLGGRTTGQIKANRYLPSGVYPDEDAVAILSSLADASGTPLADVIERFGEFLAPHLVRVAGTAVDPSWGFLDLVEHTEAIIHAMVRAKNPGARPPVLECVRHSPTELHLVYTSSRKLCRLARGLIVGMARHTGERVEIEECSCMLEGDPFCSFVIRTPCEDTGHGHRHAAETTLIGSDDDRSSAADDLVVLVANAELAMPRTIGGHRVIRLLGSGGMGRVWLAHDDRLDRDVAIKVMLPGKAVDPAARERFLRESRAAARVDHPNVVTIHHVGEEDGQPYLVMPFLEGRTLAEDLSSRGRLPPGEALRIAGEIASGLAAAHARGLIHRDIKPDNVLLVGDDRRVRIIDFGLVRQAYVSGHGLTLDGNVLGTPNYMAPECAGDRSVDGRADLFGLGVVLYEMLSGKLPFEGRSATAVLSKIATGTPIPLSVAAPDVDRAVAGLVMRMIAHAPADRPVGAIAVAGEIAELRRTLDG